MKVRRRPNATEREAAALLMIKRGDGSWLIPDEIRKGSAKSICAEVEYHHDPIPYGIEGSTDPQNLTPMRIADHDHVTRTETIPRLAKGKRLRQREERHDVVMLKKVGLESEPKINTPEYDRRFHELNAVERYSAVKKKKSKLRSRGFQGWRAFDGTPRWKKK